MNLSFSKMKSVHLELVFAMKIIETDFEAISKHVCWTTFPLSAERLFSATESLCQTKSVIELSLSPDQAVCDTLYRDREKFNIQMYHYAFLCFLCFTLDDKKNVKENSPAF